MNGAYCYVVDDDAKANVQPGETWLVNYRGLNSHGTMSIVKSVRIINSESGIHHVLSQYEPGRRRI